MNSKSSFLACSTLALAMASLCAPMGADAATSFRVFRGHATLFCQGALPAFETAIRKRPLAVQNEGASTAFVTCSFLSQGGVGQSTTNLTSAQLYVSSISGSDRLINCTGVAGTTPAGSEFNVKAVIVQASGDIAVIQWDGPDFADALPNFPSGMFSVSCQLPPGAAINYLRANFDEEIGT